MPSNVPPDPRGLDPRDSRCSTDGEVMSLARFRDRFLHYRDQPQQRTAVEMLHSEILALPGGPAVLSEDSSWAVEFSNTPPPPPAPPAPAFTNPLDVVWKDQNDNLSGTGWRECFSSSCAMVANFWGKICTDDEYNRIRARFGDTTDASAQLRTLRYLGLQADFLQNGTVAWLENQINIGRPTPAGWLHHGSVSAPSGGGHWSVVIGHTPTHWIHNDPNGVADMVNGGYTSNGNGSRAQYTRQNWNRRWLVGSPSDGWALDIRP